MSEVDQLSINALRFLAVDAVEKAKSGHPGAPLGDSPTVYLLFHEIMRHNPANSKWTNRDRFVLSNGHASAMLYAVLHLAGYKVGIDDLMQFRQYGSITPGHPEYGDTDGVEVTTGPLGQGFAMGVGMAIAERHLAAIYNRPGYDVVDHYTYVFCGDGDLMEGVSHEAGSLAGTLGLGKMIYFYDDNSISLDGPTALSFTEDVTERTERETELRRLSRQLLYARDAEQRRIARDLHETAVQSMAALKMMLGRIANLLPKSNKQARDLARSTTEIADEIIREVRTISHLMHPPLLDEGGLYPALHWYARGFSERSGIAANLQMDEGFGRLPRDTEIAIFRIVQEALTNVHRHSGSHDAIIRVARSDAGVRVEIEDHGKGMPVLSGPAGGKDVQLGVGTAGMRERVAQLRGTFEIKGAPAKGTVVSAILPVGDRPETDRSNN